MIYVTIAIIVLLLACCILLLAEVSWLHGEAMRMQKLAHDNEMTAMRLADAISHRNISSMN